MSQIDSSLRQETTFNSCFRQAEQKMPLSGDKAEQEWGKNPNKYPEGNLSKPREQEVQGLEVICA